MIDRLRFATLWTENYRNIHLEDDIRTEDLTILGGANGAGKSNLIAVLRFMKDCLVPSPVPAVDSTDFTRAVATMGDADILDATLPPPQTVTLRLGFHPTDLLRKGLLFQLKLRIRDYDTTPHIEVETLSNLEPAPGENEPFYFYKAHNYESGEGVVSVYNDPTLTRSHFEKLDKIPTNRLTLAAVPDLLEQKYFPQENTPVYFARRQITRFMSDCRFYDGHTLDIEKIRTTNPESGVDSLRLAEDGGNLTAVLDTVFRRDPDFGERVVRYLKPAMPEIRNVKTVRGGGRRVAAAFETEGLNRPLYLRELPAGVIRLLFWAVLFHAPEPPALIVADEPEAGVPAPWLRQLSYWIKSAADRCQVFVTTQSPLLLDHFGDRYRDVFRMTPDPPNHFIPGPIPEAEEAEKSDNGFRIGDILRGGRAPERQTTPHVVEEERSEETPARIIGKPGFSFTRF